MSDATDLLERFDCNGAPVVQGGCTTIVDVLRGIGATAESLGDDVERWTLPDGSILTRDRFGWGLGYATCACWQDAGHVDCPVED
jgi:hypothetical protein